MLTRLVAADGTLWARATTEHTADALVAVVTLETGVVVRAEATAASDIAGHRTVRLACTLATLRQRAASALAATGTAGDPSRPAGGRQTGSQRARRGGGR